MAEVLKITRATDDVTDATIEEQDLLFTSENNTLKIFVDELDSVANGVTFQIAHGLSYRPVAIRFAKASDNRWYPVPALLTVSPAPSITGSIDATNVNLTNSSGSTRDIRSFIMIDPIAA